MILAMLQLPMMVLLFLVCWTLSILLGRSWSIWLSSRTKRSDSSSYCVIISGFAMLICNANYELGWIGWRWNNFGRDYRCRAPPSSKRTRQEQDPPDYNHNRLPSGTPRSCKIHDRSNVGQSRNSGNRTPP